MISILIADDHSIVRRGLKEILLEEFPDALIKGVSDGMELLREARAGSWTIVISDLSMPGRNGLEVLKQLKEEFPRLPVLILSMHPENQYAIRVLRAGAVGYLTKESASDELVNAVRKIISGKKYITPDVAQKLAEILETDATLDLHETLSDREFDVLKMIASGKTVSEIADTLSLSVTTVSTYRARILFKTKMRTNAELTHYAIENRLV
jgi:two-component system invasion response regulator UvrY